MSNTRKEAIEAKQRLLSAGRLLQELTLHDGFILLLERLNKRTAGAKEAVMTAQSWEEFLSKKSYLEGLSALQEEVDTIISKGKSAERSLKKDL